MCLGNIGEIWLLKNNVINPVTKKSEHHFFVYFSLKNDTGVSENFDIKLFLIMIRFSQMAY